MLVLSMGACAYSDLEAATKPERPAKCVIKSPCEACVFAASFGLPLFLQLCYTRLVPRTTFHGAEEPLGTLHNSWLDFAIR